MMSGAREDELLALTQRLLDAIAARDWATYEQLCDPSLTCFEPEARGYLVEGLPFHQFYFDLPAGDAARRTTISSPHVRVMGEVAVVSFVRLIQSQDERGSMTTSATEETRVWRRVAGSWRMVHLHRSLNS